MNWHHALSDAYEDTARIRADLDTVLALLRALVESQPKCDVCGEPATRAWGRGAGRWCDTHARNDSGDLAPEYPRAPALRAALARLKCTT